MGIFEVGSRARKFDMHAFLPKMELNALLFFSQLDECLVQIRARYGINGFGAVAVRLVRDSIIESVNPPTVDRDAKRRDTVAHANGSQRAKAAFAQGYVHRRSSGTKGRTRVRVALENAYLMPSFGEINRKNTANQAPPNHDQSAH
jgi:hypothetical protein